MRWRSLEFIFIRRNIMLHFPLNYYQVPLVMIGYFVLYVLVLGILCGLGFIAIQRLQKTRSIYEIPFKHQQIKRELKYALLTVAVDSGLTILLLQSGLLSFQTGVSWGVTAIVFVCHFFFFEVWYYLIHRLQHTRRFFPIHAVHHQSRVCNPLTNYSGSISDRIFSATGFVIPLIFFGQMKWLDITSFYLILGANTLGSLLIHSNIELLAGLQRVPWLAYVFSCVSGHALHHSRIHGNFGLFTSFMDRLGGTYIADTPEVARRAVSGQALTSLNQRFQLPAEQV
jgi:sterol desaturase/sphingolipid hydroxylase (fatty acid hydroxylase superfamily)